MLSLSSLIDFLLSLLRDEDAQAEFERDPQGMLARHNLEGVTAQDIRDVQPMLADRDGVSCRDTSDGGGYSGGGHSGGGRDGGDHSGGAYYSGAHRSYQDDDDPVRVIHHVQNTHHVEREVVVRHENHITQEIEYKQYNTEFHYTDNSVYVADGGTYIQDSYNQDNDGVDLKGAEVEDSNVVVGNENSVGNTQVTTEETTTVTESFNEDSSEDFVVVDSGNDSSTTVQQSTVESINGSYDAQPSGTASTDAAETADPSAAA